MTQEGKGQLTVTQPTPPIPQEVVENATTQAKLLMDIVEKTNCFQEISGKKYLQVEAWETIGAFNRTHAETESITVILKDADTIGYQARVQLWKDGIVVGGAIMPCYFTENCCKGKEGDAKHKACMSAAQTFATSKAYRMNFSYVAILAGYQPLPAEEVTDDMQQDKTEHWCEEHQTNYFKKGKMKFYAHPIVDGEGKTIGWCNEKKKKDNGPKEEPVSSPSKGEGDKGDELGAELDFDPAWLLEALRKTHWQDPTVKSWCRNKYKVDTEGTVVEVIARLTKEDREKFFAEIQNRLQMV